MPFTVSHVAAVLPLRRAPSSRWVLPAAPLVLGSMAPDLVTVLGQQDLRAASHSLTGAVTVDLPLVAVSWLVWVHLLREPVRHLVPGVAARWQPVPVRGRAERLARWAVAALVGIATHLAWDSFTHDDGWATRHVAALQGEIGPLDVVDWLQLASSAVGILALGWWLLRWWRATEPATSAPPSRGAVPAACALVVLAVLGAVLRAGRVVPDVVRSPMDRSAWRALVGLGLFGAAGGALVAALLTGMVWRLAGAGGLRARR